MPRGFSLIEVVVSMAIITTATLAIAQLSIMSVRVNRVARSTTVATVLALQKIEQLQSSGWTELASSPPETLGRNTDGFSDFLDGNGGTLPPGISTPVGAAFVRRWAVAPSPGGHVLVIQVVVGPISRAGHAFDGRGPEEARIVTIKTRR